MFENPVVGGTELIRSAIQSDNYVPGVSGWTINRDGTSEFGSGTFRGPVLVQGGGPPATTLASIDAAGNISGQNGYFKDIFIQGVDIAALLNASPGGILARFSTQSTLPATGVSSAFTATAWTSFNFVAGRLYKITITPSWWKNNNSSVGSNDLIAQVVANQPGIPGGLSNKVIYFNRRNVNGATYVGWDATFYLDNTFTPPSGPMTLALQLATDGGSNFTMQNTTPYPWEFTVEDAGPLLSSSGGTGAPAGLLTYTVSYPATLSQSYDNAGVPIVGADGLNNIYLNTFASRNPPYYKEQFEVLWNAAQMRIDLAGATINWARLYLYCFMSTRTQGGLGFGVTTDTSLQNPLNDATSTGTWSYDNYFSVPAWNYINMFDSSGGLSLISQFLGTANGIISHQPLITYGTAFRACGTVGYVPYIQVNYTGNPPGGSPGYGTSPYGSGGYGV